MPKLPAPNPPAQVVQEEPAQVVSSKASLPRPASAGQEMEWSTLVACCLASSAVMLHPPLWVFNPPGVQPFDAAWADFRLLSSVSGVLLIGFLLIGGVLGDFYGRRKVWLIGLSGFVAANMLIMVTSDAPWHIVLRFSAMAFGSLFTPLILATLNLTYTQANRALALAIYVAINAGAMQVSWLQGQFFVGWVGWRATYILPILFGLLAIRRVRDIAPDSPDDTSSGARRRSHIYIHSGWTLLILAVIYGVTVLPIASDRWWMVVGATFFVGLIGGGFVLWWNLQTQASVVRRSAFRARDLTALIVTGAVINFLLVGFGMRTLGLFQVVRSMSPIGAFIALAPVLLGLIAALYLFLKAVRQYQARSVIAAGLLTMAVALAGAALLPGDASYLLFVPPLFLFGVGYLVSSTIWTSVFLRTVVARNYGVNAAINNATSSIGMAIGSALTGNLLAQMGLEIYLRTLTEANVNAAEALEALVAFKTLVLSEPADIDLVTEYFGFSLMDGYREAYVAAYAQILWIMVAFCLVTALIISFGLRGSLKATTLRTTEDEAIAT